MKQSLRNIAVMSALALPFQQAQAGEWSDYDYKYDKMRGELMFSECYTHSMMLQSEDMLRQRGNDETASPIDMLLRIFGKYARGVYLEQYRALNDIADVATPSNPPENVMIKAQGAVYLFHEGFVGDARNFADTVGIDESSIAARCANNPLSYYPDL